MITADSDRKKAYETQPAYGLRLLLAVSAGIYFAFVSNRIDLAIGVFGQVSPAVLGGVGGAFGMLPLPSLQSPFWFWTKILLVFFCPLFLAAGVSSFYRYLLENGYLLVADSLLIGLTDAVLVGLIAAGGALQLIRLLQRHRRW